MSKTGKSSGLRSQQRPTGRRRPRQPRSRHRVNSWRHANRPWQNQLVQIGLHGPFEVRTDDGLFADVPGARLRGLLIALALESGHVVPKATLVDWIWGERPPSDAANALQRLASRLRKALPAGSIEGLPGGYRLTAAPAAVDALRFERLLAQARQEEGPGRVRLLREALAMWRGAAMQDVALEDSEALNAAVTRLEGLRLTAMEDRFEAEVSLGQGADVVAELTDAVAAHPLRERLAWSSFPTIYRLVPEAGTFTARCCACLDLVSRPGHPRRARADQRRESVAPGRPGRPGLPPEGSPEARPRSRRRPRKHRLHPAPGPASAGRTVSRRGSR